MYTSSAPRDTAPARIQARNARRAAGSSVTAASLVVYENLSPTLSRIPQIPFADWALDAHSDFAAIYDKSAGAVVHFHPKDRAITNSILAAGATSTISRALGARKSAMNRPSRGTCRRNATPSTCRPRSADQRTRSGQDGPVRMPAARSARSDERPGEGDERCMVTSCPAWRPGAAPTAHDA